MSSAPLPPPLADDASMRALAELVEETFSEIDLSVLLVYLIDVVPARLLPHLADQFHVMGVEGWDFARTEDDRRALIKRSIELHRYKGTRWAIEQVFETLGMDGKVSEWFEYGGQPYRFRVDVDLSGRGMGIEDYDRLVALIQKYKNKRSRLDALSMSMSVQSAVPVVAGVLSAGEVATVYPWSPSELTQSNHYHMAIGFFVIETATIFPQEQ